MLSAPSSVAISPYRPAIAAIFNLDDPDERFMIETMQRFHGENPSLYRAHAMKRVCDAQRRRVVVEVVSFQGRRRQTQAKWMLIFWNIDDVSITFLDEPGRQAALATYRNVADGVAVRALVRGASQPLVPNPS